jgi:2-iminobutanoate/2-iminopropanoate deaminase
MKKICLFVSLIMFVRINAVTAQTRSEKSASAKSASVKSAALNSASAKSASAKATSALATVKLENPSGLPPTNGYSHAATIDLGNNIMVIMSGQVALDSAGKLVGAGDIEKQTRQVFGNIASIVKHYGGEMKHVIKLNYFIMNPEDIPGLRKVRNEFINIAAPPASTLVVVKQLFTQALLIEIEATAVIPKK